MAESSTIQAFIEEGRQEGRKRGGEEDHPARVGSVLARPATPSMPGWTQSRTWNSSNSLGIDS